MLKISAAALILLGAGLYFAYSRGEHPHTLARFDLVCVETGLRLSRSASDLRVIPGKNPDTGRFTLLPVRFDEASGRPIIMDRYRGAFDDEALAVVNRFVNPKTFEVLDEPFR